MLGTDLQSDIGHAIQLALAPVFLLTAIAGMLNVMSTRLSRIVDRCRQLTESSNSPIPRERAMIELRVLEERRKFTSSAITSCTIAALLGCLVIVILFIQGVTQLPLNWLVALLFTGSTLALVSGLALYLREVHLATRNVRIKAS